MRKEDINEKLEIQNQELRQKLNNKKSFTREANSEENNNNISGNLRSAIINV